MVKSIKSNHIKIDSALKDISEIHKVQKAIGSSIVDQDSINECVKQYRQARKSLYQNLKKYNHEKQAKSLAV
ncbi:hypothetical protein AWR27_17110 [Spirosoma montaniterrae]|uniref:Uncharacterized protein n=1 Tax=Spirosoma montaniterrae TaxID=1178516 RepID=A0A1P9WZS1_9BACT|nr:hypothetical protein AWR27_17110 [Spirosoma montaniterrae]